VPSSRYAHASCEYAGLLWVFGGIIEPQSICVPTNDLHVGSLVPTIRPNEPPTLRWSQMRPHGVVPSPRYGHSMTCVRDTLWTVAGRAATPYHNAAPHASDPASVSCLRGLESAAVADDHPTPISPSRSQLRWEQIAPAGVPPSPRSFHGAISIGDTLVIVGGEQMSAVEADGGLKYLRDVHTLHIHDDGTSGGAVQASWRQVLPTDPKANDAPLDGKTSTPPPSSLAALIVVDASVLLFGGFNQMPEKDMSKLHTLHFAQRGAPYSATA
jgi:hypothetical protein